jgi:hypothetical protein
VAGTATPAGGIVKQVSKALGGLIAAVGSLIRTFISGGAIPKIYGRHTTAILAASASQAVVVGALYYAEVKSAASMPILSPSASVSQMNFGATAVEIA